MPTGADGSGGPGDAEGDDPLPGAPATPRNRAKSAVLWGLVGGFSFLVLAQGYLLLDGDLPFAYAWLFVVAAGVAVGSAGVTYGVEHRVAKRRT